MHSVDKLYTTKKVTQKNLNSSILEGILYLLKVRNMVLYQACYDEWANGRVQEYFRAP